MNRVLEPSDSLKEMQDAFATACTEVLPSKFWEYWNKINTDQLNKYGYENFKQTVALNYFTWSVGLNLKDPQFKFLLKNLGKLALARVMMRTLFARRHKYFYRRQSWIYNFLTLLLWEYVSINDTHSLTRHLEEPLEGNPPRVYVRGKLVSQDLANSILEYRSIMESGVAPNQINTVLELGAGYGRTAFVFLSLMPQTKYIVVDIPPALYVTQRYLSSQFENRPIFKFRMFQHYDEIKEEFERSSIAFLLPSQLSLLPPKSVDLFINISSLQEMRPDQIEFYFKAIDRLTSKYFYFKQWKKSFNFIENFTIEEKDYPIQEKWTKLYWRECQVQTYFFEALFRV